ncbi:MAG: diguanylate cyclase/phosphodiesterase (GGDEF & EAL domains) with PAS/PAC sensor(s) [Candidatus Jettenia ecosi]|uniref:histidine kinase n=1 Tax=Candidatus Jettenia ecosi TaxID=2494326 RepID=A0A533QFD3_9BACT|nr:MAG: diguanylate cyclase/phosphodiesterase (GGDEF & EAL domains) with PAS/PAC sensor(s) [Candidatus Jettenia ecosi]
MFFLIHLKRQQDNALRKLGTSLVMLLAQDDEVKHALSYTQPAFLDAPIKRIKALDAEGEIGYLRVSDIQKVIVEEKSSRINLNIEELPVREDHQNPDILFIRHSSTSLDEEFFDFSIPVFEKTFSEEVFATQILSEDKIVTETKQRILGFVQIGLSTHKIHENTQHIMVYIIIPLGLSIIIGGICITFFLTRYIISPLQHLTSITLDIAKGNLTRKVNIRSRDEIGQLSINFNQMTTALEKSYTDLKQEVVEHKYTAKLLQRQVKLEELIAAISTSFINLAPNEVDTGINRALETIGKFLEVDRSYVCLYSNNSEEIIDNTHVWCAEGTEPQMKDRKEVFVERLSREMEKLKRFEVVHVPRPDDLPVCAKAEKELQELQAVRSFIIVPMIYGGSLVGFLGFDSVRIEKTWIEQDITMLKIISEIFVNALEHRRKAEMLQKAYDKLEVRVLERTVELLKTNELLKGEIAEHKRAKKELKKYEIVISQMTDLPYICDDKGNVVFVNHMFEKLTGHRPEDFLGKSFALLFDKENLKKAMDAYTRTMEGESPQYELYFKNTNILCEHKNLPLRDENGNTIGVIGIARDVTERRRMEDILRKTNQTLRALISASPVAIIVLDSYGHIKMWNPSAESMFGWKEKELLNHSLPVMLKGKHDEFRFLRNRVLRGESFIGLELRRQKRDGTQVDISLSTAPLCDSHGNIAGIVGILADITEQKRMVDELRCAKNYAENLIETANVMVIGLDIAGTIRIFNEAAEKITAYKKAEIVGKNWFETIVPKDRIPYFWQEFTNWQKNGQLPKTFENPIFTKSGKKRYISWQNTEVREHGKIKETIFFGIDITEQKRTQALVERLRLISFIKDVSVALSQGNTLYDVLRYCTEAIVHNLDAALARIWTLNEKENMLELQASAGLHTHINGSHSRVPVGKLKIGRIASERQPHLTNSIVDDPYISDKGWAEREKMVSFAGYPLIIGNNLVGVVAIFLRKPLTEFTNKALASVADIIALGIDRKQAEKALRMSESKYRMLLENLPQRIFYKDRDLVYVSCNENYARDLHIKPDEIAGKTDNDFFPEVFVKKYRTDDKRIMKSGQTEDIEEKYIKDGRECIVHTVKTPIKEEKGNVIGILGVFWDITEKVALQMESVRSRHLVALGELAAGVAHEINNPITGVINCAQILFDKSSEESSEKDIANRIIKEGKRIANIVSSLLSFARSGDRKEKKSIVSVHEILSDTLTLSEVQLRKEGIKIRLDIPHNFPEITVHPQQIQQVFLNIISNARYALNQKYPEAHDDKLLEISGKEITINSLPCLKMIFYDHGTGIPANSIEKVMDPFFTLKPRGRGTGLGLSISHGIINEHGGKIMIHSIEGEFTEVAVILPIFTLKQ